MAGLAAPCLSALAALVVRVAYQIKGILRHIALPFLVAVVVAVLVGIVALVGLAAITKATPRPPLARLEPQGLVVLLAAAVVVLGTTSQRLLNKGLALLMVGLAAGLASKGRGLAALVPLERLITALPEMAMAALEALMALERLVARMVAERVLPKRGTGGTQKVTQQEDMLALEAQPPVVLAQCVFCGAVGGLTRRTQRTYNDDHSF